MDRGYATRIWIVNNCNSYPWKQRARGSRHLVAADLIPWYVPIRWISKLRSMVFPGLKSWATKWTVATPLESESWIILNLPMKDKSRRLDNENRWILIHWYAPIRWISKLRSLVFPGLKSWATKYTVATPLILIRQWLAYDFCFDALKPFRMTAKSQRLEASCSGGF